jgi:hypothetical protein
VNRPDDIFENRTSATGATNPPRRIRPAAPKFLFRSSGFHLLAVCAFITAGFCGNNEGPGTEPEVADMAESTAKKPVQVITRRDGNVTRFVVENNELVEVTMSFNFDLTNLKSSKAIPFTATFPSRQATEAFSLSPVNPDEPWEYSFTNFHNLGNTSAVHDDSYRYSLPYAPGKKFRGPCRREHPFMRRAAERWSR